MTDENKRALIFTTGFILLIILFLNRKPVTNIRLNAPSDNTSSQNAPQSTSQNIQAQYDAPFYYNAGIYPGDNYISGGNSPFNSTVNILAQNPLLGSLSLQYFPLFGFVGMTGA